MKRQLLLKSKYFTLLVGLIFLFQFSGAQLSDNLLPNGGWEDGIWTEDFFGGIEGTVTQDTENALSGTYAGKISITVGGALNKGRLYSDTIKNADPGLYQITAWLKVDEARDVKLTFMQENTAGTKKYPGTSDPLFFVDTVYKRYRSLGRLRGGDYLQNVLMRLQVGDSVGDNYIDDVTVQEVTDWINPGFEDTANYFFAWEIDSTQKDGALATFSEETTEVNSGSVALKVDVTSSADTASQVTLVSSYDNFLAPGPTDLKFNAKASNDNDSIWINIQCFTMPVDDPADDANDGIYELSYTIADSFALSTSFAEYVSSFTIPDSIKHVRYRFLLGKQVTTYIFDDFSVVPFIPANITSTAVETGTVGELYEYQLTWEGSGTFSVSSFPVADWIDIDESGLLSGTPTAAGEYGLTITLDDGVNPATQTFTIVVTGGTSVQEIANTSIGLYPNPATEIVNISNANGSVISILDITGKAVIAGVNIDSDSFILDVNNLVSGMYIVAIKNSDVIITEKLYVE